MKLVRYRVYNFRSIEDSGWIDCEDLTTLVGVNESGKSNLLLALWKLNPVFEGKIDYLHDLPINKLSEYRKKLSEIYFVEVEYRLDNSYIEINEILKRDMFFDQDIINVKRYYDGNYEVSFIKTLFNEELDLEDEGISEIKKRVEECVLKNMPKYVYYSNYGNLSSKIYLPHAVKWLKGENITGIEKNEDQIRTLRVLFNFVGLNPEEIKDLGMDAVDLASKRNSYRSVEPTREEIEKANNDKEQRSILLQAAATSLTEKFKDWWRQGNYKFRFEADGDYFRILVSDDKRPAEVDLSLRSTGLQWFLSFYLVFLVESNEAHNNAILLLDEAGLTLHPLAQKDLVRFFNVLGTTNQIINTTHSPFIIDTENMDKAKVVYLDNHGNTVVSNDLRKNSKGNNKSIYAIHAALGLSVSDVLLQGCKVVIVEGTSDQHYLNAMKNVLIRENLINPSYEIVFVPSGGVKNISAISSVIGGKNNEIPHVIVDADKSGLDMKAKLLSGLYKHNEDKIIDIREILDIDGCEIEDLFPKDLLEKSINKLLRDADEDFFDIYDEKKPIVNQIELFADQNDIYLEDGWKVELAKNVKNSLLAMKLTINDDVLKRWKLLFKNLIE